MTDQPGATPADFDRLMEQTRAALQDLRKGSLPQDEDAEEILGEGEAADGKIKVIAEVGGRLQSLTLDPRMMRMPSEDLAQELVAAVNAALEDLQQKVAQQTDGAFGGFDPEALAEQMLEIQDQSIRQMNMFTAGMEDMLQRIARAAGTAD